MRTGKARAVLLVITTFLCCGLCAQQVAPSSSPDKQSLLSDSVNDQLPHWLSFSGEIRARFEGVTGSGFAPDSSDAYLLSRLRLNMKLQPASWFKLFVQGEDARVFGKNQQPPAPPYQDVFDLHSGYLELGDTESRKFGLRIGRQQLQFGDDRLIGISDWTNIGRAFDGVRTTFLGSNYSIDLFGASVVNQNAGKLDRATPGNLIYGLYTGFDKLLPHARVEPYFFWRRAANLLTETGVPGELGFATVGVRLAGKLPAGFDYQTELATQDGSLGSDSIQAWAGHWQLARTFSGTSWTPKIFGEFNYASGDSNHVDGHRGTFDQLYPSGHDKFGFSDQIGWKNIEHLRVGVELKPVPRWTFSVRQNLYWLADVHDGLYSSSGTLVAADPAGAAGHYVGNELDLSAVYDFARNTRLQAGYSHLFTGTFLKAATPGNSFTLPYVSLTYKF